MQPLHILNLQLDIPLRRNEIGTLRGRVAEAVGFENMLFHNHRDGSADKYHYWYPLIHYKVQNDKVWFKLLEVSGFEGEVEVKVATSMIERFQIGYLFELKISEANPAKKILKATVNNYAAK